MTPISIPGIHHITAICGDPQRNVDFYTGLLGLRLVKKTVNFDDPNTYHLYYGDGTGTPGTIMTFFAWISAPPFTPAVGRQGSGQIVATAFAIPRTSVDFWIDRLSAHAIDFDGPNERFGDHVLAFNDPDGLPVELVGDMQRAARQPWPDAPIPVEHAIRGFHGASFSLEGYERTAELLTETMGFAFVGQEGNRFRFSTGEASDTSLVDVLCQPDRAPGRMGIGVVHHIAWRAPSGELQMQWRAVLADAGYDPTPVLDRMYFRSIYYPEPGGIIFEIATDQPGFTIDESAGQLGRELKLPEWLEPRRARIEARLPDIRVSRR